MINQVGSDNSMRVFRDFKQPQSGYFIMPQQQEEKKGVSGKKIALYATGAGFGVLALMKGVMSKSFTKVLNKWKISLEKKVQKNSKLTNFYKLVLEKITVFRNHFESINNFTTLKDVALQRLMFGKKGERTFTRKIHEGITRVFDKISRRTVNTSYAKTHRRFAGLNDQMAAINERLLRENPNDPRIKEIINQIKTQISTVNTSLNDGFGINARNARLRQMNEASEGLFENFWNASLSSVRNFRSRNMYSSFIAEDYLLPHKTRMIKETTALAKTSREGLDEILKLYKEILPEKEYLQLEKQVQKASKSLKKSIDIETNKYFDKSRDLKLGAAPTDVLSILATAGTAAWFVGKSKDKDERISASLKYGIPAVGAIATSLYCSAKLISGGKALLFGLLSGWAINKVGVFADNVRKQYAVNVSFQNKKAQSDKV